MKCLYLMTRSLDPTGVGRARSQRSTRSRRGVVWCRCAASAVVGASTRVCEVTPATERSCATNHTAEAVRGSG